MDDLFDLREEQKREQEQLQRFERESLQQEADDSAYMERDRNMQMTADQLQDKYGNKQKVVVSAPVKLDMPPQDADEKESTRKRRERRILARHEKALSKNRPQGREQWFQEKTEEIRHTGRINRDAEDFFSINLKEKFREDLFSPRYVFEHYAKIKQELADFKEQIDFYDRIQLDPTLVPREHQHGVNPAPAGEADEHISVLPLEYQIRLAEMKYMYEKAELAVTTAIEATGYRYEELEPGKFGFSEKLTPEDIENAKKFNLSVREDLKEAVEATDDFVADRLMETAQEPLEHDYREMREDMKNNPGTSFISSDYLTHAYQYEAIKEMRDLMDGHPDQYLANKAVLDRMYQEVFRLMEVNGTLSAPSAAINNLLSDKTLLASRKMERVLVRRQDAFEKKMNLIRDRADYIIAGMKHLLKGDALSRRAEFTMNEFMEQPEDAIQERKAAEDTAGVYAHKLDEKKEIFVNLLRETFGKDWSEVATAENLHYMKFMEKGNKEHNSQIIQMLRKKRSMELAIQDGDEDAKEATAQFEEARKEIATHYLKKMQAFDTRELESCTDEELLARMDELQEMSIQGEQMIEAAKYTDPADSHGRSIMENHFSDDNSRMLFDLKCSIVQSYALRARSLAMIRAYAKDALTLSCFSEDAIAELLYANDPKYARDNGFTRQQLLTYAKRKLEWSEAMKDAAYSRYYHSDEMYNKYMELGKHPRIAEVKGHPKYQTKLNEAERAGMRALGSKKSLEQDTIPTYYEQLQNQIAEIRKNLKKKDLNDARSNEPKAEIRKDLEKKDVNGARSNDPEAEILRLTERCEFLQDLYALSRKNYGLSDGSGKALIPEALFRSYSSIEGQPSFHNMSEEEFRTMCRQLSAGALEQKTASKEELERYRAENVKGLLTYKKHMSEHYEMLETIFHHKLPSLVYIEEHYDEMFGYFSNLQSDDGLVTYCEDMIDRSKPADARLFHLVRAYNAIGCYFRSISRTLSLQRERDYKELAQEQKALMSVEQESFAYLDANP